MSGLPPSSLFVDLITTGHNRQAKAEQKKLADPSCNALFATPKPERLLEHILNIATSANDLILDSYLGSGTTAAVAQKMNRRYIGIEMGEHAATHCLPRLKRVIEGEQGGISQNVGWQGGGGFRFMKLGEPVFLENGAINPAVTQENINSTICVSGWTKTIRPTAGYTNKLKLQQLKSGPYQSDQRGSRYERALQGDHPAVQRHPRRPASAGGQCADACDLERHPRAVAAT